MKVNPYLNFDGKTEEAFNFYKGIFGGEFSTLQRFKDVPGETIDPKEAERVMHVSLEISDGITLMGSDISPARGHKLTIGNNVYISLHPDSKDEGQRIYDRLSEGGEIEMKYEKMFWGGWFASFKDKYGTQWMINFQEDPLPGK